MLFAGARAAGRLSEPAERTEWTNPLHSLLVPSSSRRSCRMSNIDAGAMLMALARHVDFAAACLPAPYGDVPDASHVP
jgi:hypothetical protein